ncbi:hypothetical protein M9H77_20029 [Catharanthus roseus]|uniref:Uncharacterized protein n=1 Tax=Catharanthus roseus TaxID=4058 RepID=A0ACC0AMI8_CATRO|nr:hypothetical protein M9H77_20029 [Catharanthus roseus]
MWSSFNRFFFYYLAKIVNIVGASCKRKDALLQKQYDDLVKHADDVNSRGIAQGLIDKMWQFEFVFIAQLMVNVLAKTNTMSKCLQQRTQNIDTVVRMIQTIKEDLKKYGNDDDYWEELLGVVTAFCIKNDIFVLDFIVKEMDDRFTESTSELLICISCLDPRDSFVNFDRNPLLRLSEFYSDDFSISDKFELKAQLDTYISYMRSSDGTAFSGLTDIGDLAKKMVETSTHKFFTLVYRLIELALVLPVASATVERSFSAMRTIKNDLRNRMGDEFLNDSLNCNVYPLSDG